MNEMAATNLIHVATSIRATRHDEAARSSASRDSSGLTASGPTADRSSKPGLLRLTPERLARPTSSAMAWYAIGAPTVKIALIFSPGRARRATSPSG